MLAQLPSAILRAIATKNGTFLASDIDLGVFADLWRRIQDRRKRQHCAALRIEVASDRIAQLLALGERCLERLLRRAAGRQTGSSDCERMNCGAGYRFRCIDQDR